MNGKENLVPFGLLGKPAQDMFRSLPIELRTYYDGKEFVECGSDSLQPLIVYRIAADTSWLVCRCHEFIWVANKYIATNGHDGIPVSYYDGMKQTAQTILSAFRYQEREKKGDK